MKHLKYTVILIALSLLVLSGCSLPGLGDGNAKMMSKLQQLKQVKQRL